MRLFERRKGQAALEYLMIMGIVMFLLIPLFSLVTSFTHRTRTDMKISALQDSLRNLADSADMAYSQGYPARITTSFYAPQGIIYTNVTQHYFHARIQTRTGPRDLISKTHANLTGSLPESPGSYQVTLNMTEQGILDVSY